MFLIQENMEFHQEEEEKCKTDWMNKIFSYSNNICNQIKYCIWFIQIFVTLVQVSQNLNQDIKYIVKRIYVLDPRIYGIQPKS